MGCCPSKPHTDDVSIPHVVVIHPKDYYKYPEIQNGYGFCISEKMVQNRSDLSQTSRIG